MVFQHLSPCNTPELVPDQILNKKYRRSENPAVLRYVQNSRNFLVFRYILKALNVVSIRFPNCYLRHFGCIIKNPGERFSTQKYRSLSVGL
ncbi:hypothetical protein ACFP3I_25290 [Chryseobacterium arachidis]|uniref:hypothetical protein n=1 Tax=Chryseobacterium arachidis TaxID=1416778 RepID=UPI003621F3E0